MRKNRLIITNIPSVNNELSDTSLRVKSIERATEIIRSRNRDYIGKAEYKDPSGNLYEYDVAKRKFNLTEGVI
jgi:hypothetical protein